jgi:hypothetical protein
MIYVRIVSTYPPAFGLPEETTDLTLPLRDGFASTPAEAHQHIPDALTGEDPYEVLVADAPCRISSAPMWCGLWQCGEVKTRTGHRAEPGTPHDLPSEAFLTTPRSLQGPTPSSAGSS